MNIKPVTSPLSYRFSALNLSSDGGISASIQIGSVAQMQDPINPEKSHSSFNVIMENSHYLQSSEALTILGASIAKDEKGSLREILEARVEQVLRNKGSLLI